jgi:hypothetical protein
MSEIAPSEEDLDKSYATTAHKRVRCNPVLCEAA